MITNLAAAKETFQPTEIIITAPDDWDYHFNDDDRLTVTTLYVAQSYKRAIAMPNLKPPVTTTEQAFKYREQIMQHVPKGSDFQSLMTLYLTDNTTPEEIARTKASGKTEKVKLIRQDWTVPEQLVVKGNDTLIPLRAGETIKWKRAS